MLSTQDAERRPAPAGSSAPDAAATRLADEKIRATFTFAPGFTDAAYKLIEMDESVLRVRLDAARSLPVCGPGRGGAFVAVARHSRARWAGLIRCDESVLRVAHRLRPPAAIMCVPRHYPPVAELSAGPHGAGRPPPAGASRQRGHSRHQGRRRGRGGPGNARGHVRMYE